MARGGADYYGTAEWRHRAFRAFQDALRGRGTDKAKACFLIQAGYWDCQPASAVTRFSRAKSGTGDEHFRVIEFLALVCAFEGDELIHFLCDELGYERPRKKTDSRQLQEMLDEVRAALREREAADDRLTQLAERLRLLEPDGIENQEPAPLFSRDVWVEF